MTDETTAPLTSESAYTVDDLPMGGCIPAAAHFEHLAAGNPLCQNQPGHDLFGIGKFGTVVVDPPWAFTFSTRKSEAGNNGWRGSTDRHYPNLGMAELRNLPIPDVAADDSVLWLWAVNALLDDACDLMKHWGFDYKNALTWAKTASHGGPAVGMGFWMRGATEHLLLGVKGKPKPLRRNQPTWFAAPPGRHSAKPDHAYDVIETLTPGPYLDVFARRQRDGWTCWGDEVSSPSACHEVMPAGRHHGPDRCRLPFGHEGWHSGELGASWETDELTTSPGSSSGGESNG